MIQLTRLGCRADATSIEQARLEFARCHCVVLPELLGADILARFAASLDPAGFDPRQHTDTATGRAFSRDASIRGKAPPLHMLHLVLNDPRCLAAIRTITGCAAIRGFQGRIYSLRPATGDFLDWHDDGVDGVRLIGLSINLSPQPYTGGVFQLRDKRNHQILAEVSGQAPGTAHLFRVADFLAHRVTPVEGTVARTAASGWFVNAPDAAEILRSQILAPARD